MAFPRSAATSPHVDLATVRETLSLIRDDLAPEPRLAAVCTSLDRVIADIDAVAPRRRSTVRGAIAAAFGSRFVPWRPGT